MSTTTNGAAVPPKKKGTPEKKQVKILMIHGMRWYYPFHSHPMKQKGEEKKGKLTRGLIIRRIYAKRPSFPH